MSQANVDLYERGVASLNAREMSDEVAEELLAPGFRMENISTAVTDKTYYGVAGVREWIRDTFEGLDEDACFEIEEILADGQDYVVARVRLAGHGVRSGVPVALRWVSAMWFRDGKITRTAGYARRLEALKAVGFGG